MPNILDNIYNYSPVYIQNMMISAYNLKSYRYRYGKYYWDYRAEFSQNDLLSTVELEKLQLAKTKEFLVFAKNNSNYYSDIITDDFINNFDSVEHIRKLPFLTKDVLRKNIDKIITIPNGKGIKAKTGGTTGISLEVSFTQEDIQARFAFVDNIRSSFGYKLGKKTAWFSGKKLLSSGDLQRNRFWKTDIIHKVRYYSTFHIQQENIKFYIDNLIKYQPAYLVGFPSNMYELAKYGIRHNIVFPKVVKAIFTNAESITEEMRISISSFFKAEIYDQYSSAEGAPFIFQCKEGRYHMELQSGVFEVLDRNDLPAIEGRLVVTAFYTHGTPLVRYEIGDRVKLCEDKCICGNGNPLINQILGRENDFIFSEQTGKINAGNVSNCTKGTYGIIKFRVIQNKIDEILIELVVDNDLYNKNIESIFLSNFRDRLGDAMIINLLYVDNISTENSGKFRFIKNNIKTLLD